MTAATIAAPPRTAADLTPEELEIERARALARIEDALARFCASVIVQKLGEQAAAKEQAACG